MNSDSLPGPHPQAGDSCSSGYVQVESAVLKQIYTKLFNHQRIVRGIHQDHGKSIASDLQKRGLRVARVHQAGFAELQQREPYCRRACTGQGFFVSQGSRVVE